MRSESRAAKVALMKLKMNAVGDKSVPQVSHSCFRQRNFKHQELSNNPNSIQIHDAKEGIQDINFGKTL